MTKTIGAFALTDEELDACRRVEPIWSNDEAGTLCRQLLATIAARDAEIERLRPGYEMATTFPDQVTVALMAKNAAEAAEIKYRDMWHDAERALAATVSVSARKKSLEDALKRIMKNISDDLTARHHNHMLPSLLYAIAASALSED